MKRIYFILISILMFAQAAVAVEPTAELLAETPQTPDEIRAAAREQVISSLSLSKEARKKFEPIYDEYREALAEAVRSSNEQIDDVTPLNGMKANLMSVAATAQVKLDYIDRFAEVLSSGQIYQLYNSEGAIAWTVRKRAAVVDQQGYVSMDSDQPSRFVIREDGQLVPIDAVPAPEVKQQYYRLNGKRTALITPTGQVVESDYGKIVNYHTLRVEGRIKVIIAPSVTTLKVRCDRAFMDAVKYEMQDGVLSLSIDHKKCQAWTGDMSVEVYLPVSSHLSRISANNTASVQVKTSLRADVLTFDVNNRASVSATGHLIAQKVTVNANGYSKFDANVHTTNRDGSTMKNGMVLYNIDGRSEVSGTVVTHIFVGKADGFSDFNIGTSIHEARFVLNGRSKLRGQIGATTLRVELDGYSDVTSDQITFEKSAVFQLNGRSSISAKRMSAPQGANFSAEIEGYSKFNVGSGRVTEGYVTVAGRSEFNAPSLDVRNMTVKANDYSSADVHCSGRLRAITTSQQARINYSGGCTVESSNPNVTRK